MRVKRILGAAAAALLAVSFAGTAMAVEPDNQADVSLTITPGSELSVVITGSNNFPSLPFSLNTAPPSFTASAHYNLQVVDGRGTGAGWVVTASATPFTPAVPGTGLPTTNNGLWMNICGPILGTGFCASPGSIPNGVAVTPGSPNIIAGGASIFYSDDGQTAAPSPFGTGTFQTQEAIYYTGFPVALSAGTYTTTVTLSITGTAP